jgi:carboxymethylenebutenolidase
VCHSDSSSPPVAAGARHAGSTTDLQLRAADGNTLTAYIARAAQATGRGVVILPDIRGLHGFYKELAVRFAEIGFDAVAIDDYGRTASTSDRSDAFEWQPHLAVTQPEMVAADVGAAVTHLRSLGVTSIFTVGFCWGGAGSWRQSGEEHGLAGCVGFYGGHPMTSVGPWLPKLKAPLLMLLAENDSTTPVEFEEFASRARDQGIPVESYIFAGTGHSFFDRTMTENAEACAEAWRRIGEFTDRFATAAGRARA